MKLTDRVVARLKPPPRGRLDVWDQTLPAFGIQVRANGTRSWMIAMRRPGKTTTAESGSVIRPRCPWLKLVTVPGKSCVTRAN